MVSVWCDGRTYDPETETYKPQYAYSIVTDKWRYDGNNIVGAKNELPNLFKAGQTLFDMLWHSQKSYAAHLRGAFTGGNHDVFPVHVNEWAVKFADDILQFNTACQMKS